MKIDENCVAWVRLALLPGLTTRELHSLLEKFGLPGEIFRALAAGATAIPAATAQKLVQAPGKGLVDRALRWLDVEGHNLLTLADANYPRALLDIGDTPPVLFFQGRLELLDQRALAIVGSRNATPQGARNAFDFAKLFSQHGLAVVSGLALGIDAAAHRGALQEEGSTIAVLGCGIDLRYPRSNAGLQDEIAARGAIISEFAPGTPPARYNFPRRNRLISGLSLGCLVVEAAEASGSLITARLAAEQGKDVFAIPGSIHSPVARGCHALIKQGAKLVEKANDVLEEIGFPKKANTPNLSSTNDPLVQYMGYDPIGVDTLVARCGLTPDCVSAMLLQLELDGYVGSLPGGLYQRTQ